jgi:hypothetical protein
MPKSEISASEWSAGCRAKISAPSPTTTVKAEKKMAVLCVSSILRPVLYSLSSPSMMKMLKSSPMPNMKVERMIVTMLNSMPSMAISPRMMTHPTAIGSSDMSVSSIRP